MKRNVNLTNCTTFSLAWLLSWSLAAFFATPFVTALAGEDEVIVGHSGSGQLKVEVGFEAPLGLEVSVFPGFPGYATGEVGFHSAPFDEPAEDLFQLSSGADLRFILVAKDAGMEVLNDHGSAFMQVGETFYLGIAPFDEHPLWDLVSGTPGNSYSLTLKIRDVNGVYTESDPFVLSFTPNPPVMSIQPAAPGFVTVSWAPATSGFVLQMASGLNPSSWTNAPSGSTNPVTVATSPGAMFFRVRR
jgi:hypothetical protein